jgi:GNAT superfamily N-acetyltransferase
MTADVPGPRFSVSPDGIAIRPFTDADRAFFQRAVDRLKPEESVALRDPDTFAAWFHRLANGELDHPPGTETFVAADRDDRPLGLLMVQPAKEYFTGGERAYVEVLAVTGEAEGRGVGRALMEQAEKWARARGYGEIALDVFASNDRAIRFYQQAGYEADHIRMVKRLR